MLKSHFDVVEEYLLTLKKIGDNTGHPLHKGSPREAFIQEFLKNHISEKVSIGTGEIIDYKSKPNEKRNQHDIVIYKNELPKIDFGGGINGFLIESVVATIEVKSELSDKGLEEAIKSAKKVKELKTESHGGFGSGWRPPAPLNFIVSYNGPAKMSTVYNRIKKIYKKRRIEIPELPNSLNERKKIPSPAIDAIFVLGKGFVQFDNFPISFISDTVRQASPNANWNIIDTKRGSLLMLFISITQAISGSWHKLFDAVPYLSNFKVPDSNIQFR